MKAFNNKLSVDKDFLPAAWIFLVAVLIPIIFSACDDQRVRTVTWTEYEPVYMSEQEFQNAVSMDTPRDLVNPGKIYLYEGFLFVNEVNKGVHIIDNRDPASPSRVGFINIPANKDIAVEGDRLYADSHSDLLVFDISDLQNAKLIARKEGVFEFTATQFPGFPFRVPDPSKGIVVDWKPVEVEEVCKGDCHPQRVDIMLSGGDTFNTAEAGAFGAGAGGIGGSTARFAITGDHLYAVDQHKLHSFDISSEVPTSTSTKEVGWNIETIFPYKQNLFIGSESAMYIYDISQAGKPEQLSVYSHFTACDPVVVEGDYAFVTLRNSERCPQGVNRLEVIDVSNLTSPKMVASRAMLNPHGLGIDNGTLFISEGEEGLKIMDASNPLEVIELRHITDIKARDVIPYDNVLMITGDDGIIQYDYSDIENLQLLSTIPVIPDPES